MEKKQIKALEKHGKQLVKYNNEKESSAHSKQKEIYEEIVTKRLKEIQDLSKQIDFNNLTYRYNVNNDPKTLRKVNTRKSRRRTKNLNKK